MKVKVIKCHSGEWYSRFIGGIFSVAKVGETKFDKSKIYIDVKEEKLWQHRNRSYMTIWVNDIEIVNS